MSVSWLICFWVGMCVGSDWQMMGFLDLGEHGEIDGQSVGGGASTGPISVILVVKGVVSAVLVDSLVTELALD